MANYTIQVMDKIYVALRSAGENGLPTGYMCPHGTTVTAKKLMSRQDACTDKKLDPVILDNEPRIGFRISRAAIYRGYGGTNTSMAIEDPRGFEVHISVTNTVMLFSKNLIQDGMIMTPCVWGRDGSQTVLLPISSDPYKEALINDERRSESISVRNLKPGYRVLLKNGQEAIYYGKVYAHTFDVGYNHIGDCGKEYDHLFQVFEHQHDQSKHELSSTLKHYTGLGMSKILDSNEIQAEEIEQTLNSLLHDTHVSYSKKTGPNKRVLAFSVDPQISVQVEERPYSGTLSNLYASRYSDVARYAILHDESGNRYIATRQNFAVRPSGYHGQSTYIYDYGYVSVDHYGTSKISDYGPTTNQYQILGRQEINKSKVKQVCELAVKFQTKHVSGEINF